MCLCHLSALVIKVYIRVVISGDMSQITSTLRWLRRRREGIATLLMLGMLVINLNYYNKGKSLVASYT